MRIKHFEWDEANVWKPLRHGIEIAEVEEAFHNRPILFLNTHSGRYLALGRTDSGRLLTIVFERKKSETVRPITAREMTMTETRYYRKRES